MTTLAWDTLHLSTGLITIIGSDASAVFKKLILGPN